MTIKRTLLLAALGEAATGVLLVLFPATIVRLLCGWEISGPSVALSRFLGISLLSIGVACGPAQGSAQPLLGMLTYSALATVFLVAMGISGNAGILLWPAVVVHAILAAALGRAWLKLGANVGE